MRANVAAVLLLVLLSVLVLCSVPTLSADPEKKVKECKQQCDRKHDDEEQKRVCGTQCEKQFREGGQKGSGTDEDDKDDDEHNILTTDPEKKLRDSRDKCPDEDTKARAQCRYHCQQTYGRDTSEEKEENPYVFWDKHFDSEYRTEHGTFDVLRRFAEKSELLKGIDHYRVAVLEVNPQTFIMPGHYDADGVLFVAQGRGTFTRIEEERRGSDEIKRHSFNIETGDVFRNPAGTSLYLVNKDETQKLVIVALIRPVNLPGSYQTFFGPGGENPESFFRAFSPELLEAAFKVDREKLQKIFQQKDGAILKASREQVKALSHEDEEESGGIWPFSKESSSAFNLLRSRPTQRNNYGQLWEVKPEDLEQFRDLDLMVSFANITQGAMAGPFYNSKATKIAYVVDGEGYLEMACPHVSSSRGSESQQQGHGQTYGKVSSKLARGIVFIVPAGHPVAVVASANKDLQVLCFEVNAQGNFRFPLAGKDNVMSKMERVALELGFGVSGKEVEQIFNNNQDEELFFAGPEWKQSQQQRA
ncbi:Vicilin Pis v 3.0101 [Linum grandiflorum]